MLKFEAKKGNFAKLWQKLGGGGYSPPDSAAHVVATDDVHEDENDFS